MATEIIMKPQLISQYLNDGISFWRWDVFPDGIFLSHGFHQLHSATVGEAEISLSKGLSRVQWSSFLPLSPGGISFWKRYLGSSIPDGV